jgi:hypothetical protein
MVNPIVTVNLNILAAPAPSTLQQKGAIVSQGGTTLAAGKTALITQPSDFTAIAANASPITSLTWSGGVVTATTAAPHGLPDGETIDLVISGATPAAYNGGFACTITGASTFTYPLTNNPGSETVPGAWIPGDEAELNAAVVTYFSQPVTVAISILELGEGNPADGVTALNTYIEAQPTQPFYRYIVPTEWASEVTFPPFGNTFAKTNSKTYFHIKVNQENYTNFANMKWAVTYMDAPNVPATEYGTAWMFAVLLNLSPAPTNKVTPTAFAFGFNITPYPVAGNNALFTALKAAGVNWAGTGAEGQLTNIILFYGTTMDGRDGSFWYGVDWVQINIDIRVSAAVINGSNNPINPLYYDQSGIDQLQQVAYGVLTDGVTFGMINGTVQSVGLDAQTFNNNINTGVYAGMAVINAIPFVDYVATNPSDFPVGTYNGFAVLMVMQRGFISILFVVNVTDLPSQ